MNSFEQKPQNHCYEIKFLRFKSRFLKHSGLEKLLRVLQHSDEYPENGVQKQFPFRALKPPVYHPCEGS